jgi:hypothetical protein
MLTELNGETAVTHRCPHCHKETVHVQQLSNVVAHLKCNFCLKDFTTELQVVRAARTRNIKRVSGAYYFEKSVRFIDGLGKESLKEIPFKSYTHSEFDMHAGDVISFYYINGDIRSIHNETINNVHVYPDRTIQKILDKIRGIIGAGFRMTCFGILGFFVLSLVFIWIVSLFN